MKVQPVSIVPFLGSGFFGRFFGTLENVANSTDAGNSQPAEQKQNVSQLNWQKRRLISFIQSQIKKEFIMKLTFLINKYVAVELLQEDRNILLVGEVDVGVRESKLAITSTHRLKHYKHIAKISLQNIKENMTTVNTTANFRFMWLL